MKSGELNSRFSRHRMCDKVVANRKHKTCLQCYKQEEINRSKQNKKSIIIIIELKIGEE